MNWVKPQWQQYRDPSSGQPQQQQLPRVNAALADAYQQSVQQQYASAVPSSRQGNRRPPPMILGNSDPSGSSLVDPITGWLTGKAADAWGTVKGWF